MIPVELPKSATIKDLKHVIAERMNVDPTIVPSPHPIAQMLTTTR